MNFNLTLFQKICEKYKISHFVKSGRKECIFKIVAIRSNKVNILYIKKTLTLKEIGINHFIERLQNMNSAELAPSINFTPSILV